MILKASQRSGAGELAAHLLRTDENEHVEIHALRGFVADDLHGAFKEAQAMARGTMCRQYLFSLSLNPPETESVPVADFEAAIERIEQKLGLSGQPRAIVFHEKEGRRHCHAVWSRIDTAKMKAVNLPYFKKQLRTISRELYLEHGWKMPRGLMNSQDRDPRNFTLAEWQQAKRTGQDPREIKAAIQECWAVSDSRATLKHALEERGFWLARGDRRGFVVIDFRGEVYSLSRAAGLKTKEVTARIGSPDALPSVTQTKAEIAAAMTDTVQRHIEDSRIAFKHKTATLAHNKALLVRQQQDERKALTQKHKQRCEQEAKARTAKLPRGLKALWTKVTGRYAVLEKRNEKDFARCQTRDRLERDELVLSQLARRKKLQSKIRDSRDKQATLLRDLRRDVLHYLQLRDREEKPQRSRRRTRTLNL